MARSSTGDEVRERLSLGWTPLPAYPGRLGVAGSLLIAYIFPGLNHTATYNPSFQKKEDYGAGGTISE